MGHTLSKTPLCPDCAKAKAADRNGSSYYQTKAWRRLSRAAIRRDGECAVCMGTYRLTANHIIPRREGGPDSLPNLMTMCGPCHSTYEADTRHGKDTELRRLVDGIRRALIAQGGLG